MSEDMFMRKDAKISCCGKYRYFLSRNWDENKGIVLFIGLNPSTADANVDDPTIRRCIKYAQDWGFGGLYMANLFAYRATEPKDMMQAKMPVGMENDWWLEKMASEADLIVAAWGNDGCFMGRSYEVKSKVNNLHYLKLNASGEPAHPLYLNSSLKPKLLKVIEAKI